MIFAPWYLYSCVITFQMTSGICVTNRTQWKWTMWHLMLGHKKHCSFLLSSLWENSRHHGMRTLKKSHVSSVGITHGYPLANKVSDTSLKSLLQVIIRCQPQMTSEQPHERSQATTPKWVFTEGLRNGEIDFCVWHKTRSYFIFLPLGLPTVPTRSPEWFTLSSIKGEATLNL